MQAGCDYQHDGWPLSWHAKPHKAIGKALACWQALAKPRVSEVRLHRRTDADSGENPKEDATHGRDVHAFAAKVKPLDATVEMCPVTGTPMAARHSHDNVGRPKRML